MAEIVKIKGLVAAPFTPFKKDGVVDYEKISVVAEHLIANGIKGIFVCGSTGEGPSMTVEERKMVLEEFLKSAKGKLFVFAHVGHNSLDESVALAKHAVKAGADAISATPPSYYKINNNEVLVASMEKIAKAAPELPFYFYNIPTLTAIDLDMVHFLREASTRMPNFAGIKYTCTKIHEYQASLHEAKNRKDILYGHDELMLSALSVGAEGFIGSTFNFGAPIYHNLIKYYEAGDMETARKYQQLSVQMVRLIVKYGGLSAQKAMMKMIGIDCGPMRLPLANLSDETYNNFQKELKEIGFFNALVMSNVA